MNNKVLHLSAMPSVHLRWTCYANERVPTFRDGDGCLLYPYNEYLDNLSRTLTEQQSTPTQLKSQLDAATYALKHFCEFMLRCEKPLSEIDDKLLLEYRTQALKSVKSNPRYRGDEPTAKRTVNVKLRQIYRFLSENQKHHRIPLGTIGNSLECRVRSTLPLIETNPTAAICVDEKMHPVCFSDVGSNSRENPKQYWATSEDIDALEEHFWQHSQSTYVSARNTLMLRIGEQMGWRISSINSLEIKQFSDPALKQQAKNQQFVVTPSFQKLGHALPFPMRWELAEYVGKHIREERADLLHALGVSELVTGGKLFLSASTGLPLTTQTAKEIFSDAFKVIGAPKGSGSQSLRRFRAEDATQQEVTYRRASGLSMAPEDIKAAVQDVLGHASVLSQRSYTRVVTSYRLDSPEEKLNRRLLAAQTANTELRAQNMAAEQKIKELEARLEISSAFAKQKQKQKQKQKSKMR